ncbi:MAG: alpha/beta fold hydrolase [Solirubrobacteraceae bacterium]
MHGAAPQLKARHQTFVHALTSLAIARGESLPAVNRGGFGSPLVLLHGFTGTWRIWTPVLPSLQAHHDVLAITLPGRNGGPAIPPGADVSIVTLADGIERVLDAPVSAPRTSAGTRSATGWRWGGSHVWVPASLSLTRSRRPDSSSSANSLAARRASRSSSARSCFR